MGCSVHPSAQPHRFSDAKPEWNTLYYGAMGKLSDGLDDESADGPNPACVCPTRLYDGLYMKYWSSFASGIFPQTDDSASLKILNFFCGFCYLESGQEVAAATIVIGRWPDCIDDSAEELLVFWHS
jgi:hypothetical protein